VNTQGANLGISTPVVFYRGSYATYGIKIGSQGSQVEEYFHSGLNSNTVLFIVKLPILLPMPREGLHAKLEEFAKITTEGNLER